jgi:hypothetical protein
MLNPAGLWSEGQKFLERKGRKKKELLVRVRCMCVFSFEGACVFLYVCTDGRVICVVYPSTGPNGKSGRKRDQKIWKKRKRSAPPRSRSFRVRVLIDGPSLGNGAERCSYDIAVCILEDIT